MVSAVTRTSGDLFLSSQVFDECARPEFSSFKWNGFLGQGHGYSGIENPLFYKENARMFYGDARKSIDELLTRVH